MAGAVRYLRVIGSTAVQGVFTAAWYAAGELPPARRRAARAGATLTAMAVGWVTSTEEDRPNFKKIVNDDPDRPEPERSNVAALVGIGLAAALFVGSRRLEKRWLTGLQRSGHPYPHVALGVRMGVLTTLSTLPGRLIKAQQEAGEIR